MIKWIGNKLPLLRDIYQTVRAGFFQFRGVYANFREAEAAARGRRLGFNHREIALFHKTEIDHRLDCSEYTVLFHLHRILRGPSTVLDFGGAVGTYYFRYRKLLDLEKVSWVVCDLPEMVIVGRELCAGVPNITFVNDITEVKSTRIDVLLACGCLQYVDIASPDLLLRQMIAQGNRPANILIDQLPLCDGQRFVTLQHSGHVRFPVHVFNRAEFVESIANLGYELVDCWDNRSDFCFIPFHPERSVRALSGLCFRDTQTYVQ